MGNRGRVFLSTTSARQGGHGIAPHGVDPWGGEYQPLPIKCEIGSREVVGYGLNGEESYIDVHHAPFPAIRFKEDTPEILKLKEKEKGDWKKMTAAKKKKKKKKKGGGKKRPRKKKKKKKKKK